jgi:hypothetical protein
LSNSCHVVGIVLWGVVSCQAKEDQRKGRRWGETSEGRVD